MDNPPRKDDAEIADAASLFREPTPPSAPNRTPGPSAPVGEGAYDVAGLPDPVEPPAPVVPPVVPARPRPAPAPKSKTPRPHLEPSEAVEQVWSRGAEWGPTLALLAGAGGGLLFLLYLLLSFEQYGLAFLALVGGGLGLVLLSYPILITLERPVRITPEQAVKDYFGALSHHAPHYRRMWLLLSNAGRVSGAFASPEGFRGYWKERLAALKQGRASGFTPLKFVVEDFKSEKSAGKTAVDATYSVKVFVRGRQEQGPVESYRVATSLARGPDQMWYLDKGTLP